MPFEPETDFYVPGIEGDSIFYFAAPFRVALAEISDQKFESAIPWLTKSEGTKIHIVVEKISRQPPPMKYIVISTPIRTGDGDYRKASELMDGFAGLLRTLFGNNLLRQFVREAAVDISSGDMKTVTRQVPVPSESEGPFATENICHHLEEVSDAVSTSRNSNGRRIALATQLIERAFSSPDSLTFFSYWVALEVAADTHRHQRIISLLATAYDESNSYIQNSLGFQHLWETRTAVVHHGEEYDVPADIERYIQCLFLDIARAKLGLSCRGYMAAMVAAGFDVNFLDRTKGQRTILTITPHN